jgi:hypothetical protein
MEVNPILMNLTIYGRIYSGLTAEEGFACAEKAVSIAGINADVIDLIDAFDDVWAASLLAGTIKETEDSTPIHPLSYRERFVKDTNNIDDKAALEALPDSAFDPEPAKPKRYKDKKYVAVVKERTKKRRSWDKN